MSSFRQSRPILYQSIEFERNTKCYEKNYTTHRRFGYFFGV
jgi:hypothetical protein